MTDKSTIGVGEAAARAPRLAWQTEARQALMDVLPVNERHGHCWCDGPDNPGLARHEDTCPARILERFEQALEAARAPRLEPPDLFRDGWSAGFQEALQPDRYPHRDRCLDAWRELAAARSALPPLPDSKPTFKGRDLDVLCARCGRTWGKHISDECPDRAGSFQEPNEVAALPRVPEPNLLELVTRLQREQHERAVASSPMFSVEHWKHNAGPDWPEKPDDDSYLFFENCQHPDCTLVRTAHAVEPTPRAPEPDRLGKAVSNSLPSYLDTVCARCGQNWGKHIGDECPDRAGSFQELNEALPRAPVTEPDMIAKWREHAIEAGRLAHKHEQDFDGANAHAFRKERRIWTTCADELEALRAARAGAEAPPPEEPK
jgi:hypothetical protein